MLLLSQSFGNMDDRAHRLYGDSHFHLNKSITLRRIIRAEEIKDDYSPVIALSQSLQAMAQLYLEIDKDRFAELAGNNLAKAGKVIDEAIEMIEDIKSDNRHLLELQRNNYNIKIRTYLKTTLRFIF